MTEALNNWPTEPLSDWNTVSESEALVTKPPVYERDIVVIRPPAPVSVEDQAAEIRRLNALADAKVIFDPKVEELMGRAPGFLKSQRSKAKKGKAVDIPPYKKIGGRVQYKLHEVMAWLEKPDSKPYGSSEKPKVRKIKLPLK